MSSSTITSSENRSTIASEALVQQKVLELLDLFLIGWFGSNDSRTTTTTSDRCLLLKDSFILRRFLQPSDDTTSLMTALSTESSKASDFLLSLESTLENVRVSAKRYLNFTICQERQVIHDIHEELKQHSFQVEDENQNFGQANQYQLAQSHSDDETVMNWQYLASEVFGKFKTQLRNEEKVTRDFLQALDSFYDYYCDGNFRNLEGYPPLNFQLVALEASLQRRETLYQKDHVLRCVLNQDLTATANLSAAFHDFSSTTKHSSYENILQQRPKPNRAKEKSKDEHNANSKHDGSLEVEHESTLVSTFSRSKQPLPTPHFEPITTIHDLVESFLSNSKNSFSLSSHHSSIVSADDSSVPQFLPNFVSALVKGSQGSGKSFLCGKIEQRIRNSSAGSMTVIRPQIPLDFISGCTSVGESEDRIIALFRAGLMGATQCSNYGKQDYKQQPEPISSAVLLLDDIDQLFFASGGGGGVQGTSSRSHRELRMQSTLLGLMDYIPLVLASQQQKIGGSSSHSRVLFICTINFDSIGSGPIDSLFARFDYVFQLQQPNRQQREELILSACCLPYCSDRQMHENEDDTSKHQEKDFGYERDSCHHSDPQNGFITTKANRQTSSSIAEVCVGRSYVEISQMCRDAIQDAFLAVSKGRQMSAEKQNYVGGRAVENTKLQLEDSSLIEENDYQGTTVTTKYDTTTSRKTIIGNPQFTTVVLDTLQGNLHERKPQSLRNGILRDFVDMNVYSAKDLLALHDKDSMTKTVTQNHAHSSQQRQNIDFELQLYGSDIEKAWKEILRFVIIPLCQQKKLSELMYGTNEIQQQHQQRKSFCGGILLHGASGTGKTSLAYEAARYVASVGHGGTVLSTITLMDVSCTSMVHKEVGGSEQALSKLFQAARQAAPCIILLDGIETIASHRGNDTTTEGSLDRLLSTLLVELDGVDDYSTTRGSEDVGGIAVIGITLNKAWIDPALQRPGRLSKSVRLGIPEESARRQIIQRELSNEVKGDDENKSMTDPIVSQLVSKTTGKTGAEVVAACQLYLLSTKNSHKDTNVE